MFAREPLQKARYRLNDGPKVQTNRGSYRGRMVRAPSESGYP